MPYNVSNYIIERVRQQGVEVLFGVPAYYCASLFDAAALTPNFKTIVLSSDLEAGYAADGYARQMGLSIVSVAYGVGTLSLLNAVAGAYIERSPIVVVNGGPSDANIRRQTEKEILFSHSMGRPHGDLEAFRPFTAFCERVPRLEDATRLIDTALTTALTRKHPVYLEIPQRWLDDAVQPPRRPLDLSIPAGTAAAAAQIIAAEIRRARRPLLILGIEIARYGLEQAALQIIDTFRLSFATTLLAKSVLPERHPRFLGVFNGDKSERPVVSAITQADLIVSLGAVFGSGHATLIEPRLDRTIRVWDGTVRVRNERPQPAGVTHLVERLAASALDEDPGAGESPPDVEVLPEDTVAAAGEHVWDGDRDSPPVAIGRGAARAEPNPVPNGLSYDAVFAEIQDSSFLDSSMVVVADTFLGIYPAARMKMPDRGCFVTGSIWASIGHSVGAAVGIAAARTKRPVVVCGDGGFQMIAQSLATMAREQQNSIVVLVNNGLHGYEQYLLDPRYYGTGSTEPPLPYAVLASWDYVALARALGVPLAATVDSSATLRAALARAKAHTRGPAFIHALVRSRSLPQALT